MFIIIMYIIKDVDTNFIVGINIGVKWVIDKVQNEIMKVLGEYMENVVMLDLVKSF